MLHSQHFIAQTGEPDGKMNKWVTGFTQGMLRIGDSHCAVCPFSKMAFVYFRSPCRGKIRRRMI